MSATAEAVTVEGAPVRGSALLGPMESPLLNLETRVEFLRRFFEDANAEMENGALLLFLTDILMEVQELREAWDAAWTRATGKPPREA